MRNNRFGFTLIEVLLALAVMAIAVTTLLKTLGFNIQTNQHLQDKTAQHIVAMNAIAQLQMHSIAAENQASVTESVVLMGKKWYWRALIINTPIHSLQQIKVTVGQRQEGPFQSPVIAYRYQS